MSQQPCLPVSRRRKHPSDGGDDVDTMEPVSSMEIPISDLAQSMDALQYLAMVREQAEQLPQVFVSEQSTQTQQSNNGSFAPIDGSAAATEYLFSHRMKLIQPPSMSHLPCYSWSSLGKPKEDDEDKQMMALDEWIQTTLEDFSVLRQYLCQCSDAGLGSRWTTTSADKPDVQRERIPVPASKDRSGWHIFCLGREEAMGNAEGYFDHEEEEDVNEDTDSETDQSMEENNSKDNSIEDLLGSNDLKNTDTDPHPLPSWNVKSTPSKGFAPTTRLLCQFDQILTRRVLSHHVHYLCAGWVMTRSRGLWIYALLSRLEKPLHRDDASLLRKLLRELCRLRAQLALPVRMEGQELTSEEITLSITNILITIIGFYFEQSGDKDGIMKTHIIAH
jgi:survival of motor neuron protein-interacting protein 1